jgi:hypothetical protein
MKGANKMIWVEEATTNTPDWVRDTDKSIYDEFKQLPENKKEMLSFTAFKTMHIIKNKQ